MYFTDMYIFINSMFWETKQIKNRNIPNKRNKEYKLSKPCNVQGERASVSA